MIPLTFESPQTLAEAQASLADADAMALAGGTTVVDLMKLNLATPSRVVSIRPRLDPSVAFDGDELRIGAGCTMSAAASSDALRENAPALRQSLITAASPQIRNMATLGGNLLQRTRFPYFRHLDMDVGGPDPKAANDALPFGSGADTGLAAVLGHGGRLVGTYPGDFAVAFVAFDGTVDLSGPDGERSVPAREFYREPAEGEIQYGTVLKPGELITALRVPASGMLRNSFYMKVRERSSYAFALASAAIGLRMDGDTIAEARVGLGGLGSIPWHSPEAEQALTGRPATDETFAAAAAAALDGAEPPAGVEFKVPLAKRTIVRALQTLRDEGVLSDRRLWAMQHGRG